MEKKNKDPDAFTIPCTIRMFNFAKALYDLGASINLMQYAIFHKLGLGKLQPTTMRLVMADQTIKKPMGILHDVLVKVDRFIFLTDFVILDYALDHEIPTILRRTFLATERALVDVEYGGIKFFLNDKEVYFNVSKSTKQLMDLKVILVIDSINGEVKNYVDVSLVDEPLVGVLWNYERDKFKAFEEVVTSLVGLGTCTNNPIKLDLDLKNLENPLVKPSILELPQIKLKPLPPHLQYVFLGKETLCLSSLQVILNPTKWL
ncbi:uncharacterized protein LOC107852941 [Capsicum annuum]|uniref:uncharacterized protein LOC107852941 n=1 Tax=Capsicum annuum TaxID=4072 RepID=UPI0007BFBA20|nr:uncharacterized protein LOC107852941 [Capsicum annuum]